MPRRTRAEGSASDQTCSKVLYSQVNFTIQFFLELIRITHDVASL